MVTTASDACVVAAVVVESAAVAVNDAVAARLSAAVMAVVAVSTWLLGSGLAVETVIVFVVDIVAPTVVVTVARFVAVAFTVASDVAVAR